MSAFLSHFFRSVLRNAGRLAVLSCVSVTGAAVWVGPTQDAIANGDTRSLSLQHMHTGETIDITFKQDGRYNADALKKLNWFLRDWRRDEPTRMDPRLFDIVWAAYREVGASGRIHVVSAYRSPETNAALRRRSRGVAKFSQHTLGKAMDFYIPGVATSRIRIAGLRLQRGGVGFYPTANTPFVHLDAGSVRMWPKMTRSQLAQVFPDGKTVHIPSDGKPMAGYAAAYAEVIRSGGAVRAGGGGSENDSGGGSSRSLFAGLFGNDDEGDAEYSGLAASKNDSAVAMLLAQKQPRAPAQPTVQVAAVTPDPVKPRALSSSIVVGNVEQAPPAPAIAETVAPASTAKSQADDAVALPVEKPVQPALVADVPMPTRKPIELITAQNESETAVADGAAIASDVPIPPMRPSVDPEPKDAVLVAGNQTMKPVPLDDKPAEELVAELTPAPALAPGKAISADVGASLPPSRALAFAPASEPEALLTASAPVLPPARPKLFATPAEKVDFVAAASPQMLKSDTNASTLSRPDLSASQALIARPLRVVAMKFGAAPYGDLRTDRFSGAAIKPLRVSLLTSPESKIASAE